MRAAGSGSVTGRRLRLAALALAVALSLLALAQAHHRAGQGRGALLKWAPAFEALERGDPIYEVGAEGYPTLPLSLLLLRPLHALGPTFGPLAWSVIQVALAWWIVTRALALAAGRARDFPPLGTWVVLLLSFRVLLSDVLHGNLNLLVGAAVATAAWDWRHGRAARCGLWLGFGAVLKVTPALGLGYLLWKRSGRGVAGMALGVALFALVVPALVLGLERNGELAASWWRQMIVPYVEGRQLGLLQTEHINQSLLGVLARWTTDAVAIPARPPVFGRDVALGVLSLGPRAFRLLHVAAGLAVLAWAARCVPRGADARTRALALGEFSMLALAMVFLSERSWKHHYVLLAFPIAFLVDAAARGAPGDATRRVALAGLAASAALHGLTGSAVLGARGSDLAEAAGAYLAGGLALYLAVGWILRRRGDRSAAPRDAGAPGRADPQ